DRVAPRLARVVLAAFHRTLIVLGAGLAAIAVVARVVGLLEGAGARAVALAEGRHEAALEPATVRVVRLVALAVEGAALFRVVRSPEEVAVERGLLLPAV